MAQPKLERREVLKVLCASTGALCGGMLACGGADPFMTKEVFVKLPAVIAGSLTLALADFPQLKQVGGALVGSAAGMSEPIAVTRQDETSFAAMPALCTHLSCPLRYNQLTATLDCGCHGSTFELDGSVINGPATKPLRTLKTEFSGGDTVRIVVG